MNITVLYDPRGARALFSMKYHYIPLLAILSKLYDYNLEIAAYPAQKFGYRYHHTTVESYVQNCVALLEPNKTEMLAILNCLTHCEFCMEISLCQQAQSLYTPACIKQVKGDLRLLLTCELNKRHVVSRVYERWYVHWQKFHSHGTSANPVVLLLDGAQESLNIMDTGLIDRVCDHLNSSSKIYEQFCGEFDKKDIQRMIVEDPDGHLIVSPSQIEEQPFTLILLCFLMAMFHTEYQQTIFCTFAHLFRALPPPVQHNCTKHAYDGCTLDVSPKITNRVKCQRLPVEAKCPQAV